MTKEALLSRLLYLPTKNVLPLREPEDREIVEGNNGSVHYKMTKELANISGAPEKLVVFSLSVSGQKMNNSSSLKIYLQIWVAH